MSSNANSKPMVTDVFVKGAVHGWQIATSSTIPNVLMAFVIIKILKHSGLLDIIGQVFDPVMALLVFLVRLPRFSWAHGCPWVVALAWLLPCSVAVSLTARTWPS